MPIVNISNNTGVTSLAFCGTVLVKHKCICRHSEISPSATKKCRSNHISVTPVFISQNEIWSILLISIKPSILLISISFCHSGSQAGIQIYKVHPLLWLFPFLSYSPVKGRLKTLSRHQSLRISYSSGWGLFRTKTKPGQTPTMESE